MKICKTFSEAAQVLNGQRTVVTIGNFDGVHLGHQKIIQRTITLAAELEAVAVVLTFANHTTAVLGEQTLLINSPTMRCELIATQGTAILLEITFDAELSATTPERFFEQYLVKTLQMKALVIGYDFRFGRSGAGDYQILQQLCNVKQLLLERIAPLSYKNEVISSSRIRKSLQTGELEAANQMLGYTYFITGVIQPGVQLARKLGFPTANLYLNTAYLIPKYGVYLVRCIVKNDLYYGIANLGVKPTFGGKVPLLEVHLFELELDLYQQAIQVNFLKFIREERTFAGIKQLETAIKHDLQLAKDYLKELF